MTTWVSEMGGSESRPAMGRIEVASPGWGNITSPETEQTSRWCSDARPWVEPMKEATQMTTAQAVGAASHTSLDFPSECESAASQYRVGLVCF